MTKISENFQRTWLIAKSSVDIFESHGIKATFFCIADQLDQPETLSVFHEIVSAGHEIGNHTLTHPAMEELSADRIVADIVAGHEKILDLLGVRPRGYRAPSYFITAEALRKLAELDYLYDSSICNAKLTRFLVWILRVWRRNFRATGRSRLQHEFPCAGPLLIDYGDEKRLIEWPIPSSLGLNYYGTFHCVAPKFLFYLQTRVMGLLGQHVHYEIHPIEVVTRECVRAFPWLRNIPFVLRDDLLDWLNRRLETICSSRSIATLENLSETYLHSCRS